MTGSSTPYKVAIGGEAGWNTRSMPLVFLLVAPLVALGLTNRRWSRILGRESRWLVLVPIWTALIYAPVRNPFQLPARRGARLQAPPGALIGGSGGSGPVPSGTWHADGHQDRQPPDSRMTRDPPCAGSHRRGARTKSRPSSDRPPNHLELALFAVMWSEHCSYKSSRIHLRRLPTEGPLRPKLVGPGRRTPGSSDAGDGDRCGHPHREAINHPSAIEPYQGAVAIPGWAVILRDIFTMGARPIAVMDPLFFGRSPPGPPEVADRGGGGRHLGPVMGTRWGCPPWAVSLLPSTGATRRNPWSNVVHGGAAY